MRFFTKELWCDCNSNNVEVREHANAEWIKNCNQYRIELDNTKKYLSESFWSMFQAREGLHDYLITRMDIETKNHQKRCVILIRKGNDSLRLILHELMSINIVADLQNFDRYLLTWGYSEIEYTPRNTLKLSIICEISKELSFECKSLELIVVQ